VARALIVGCGCRGRELGVALLGRGWRTRGTTRDPGRAAAIAGAGIEPAVADPDRAMTILDHVGDVTLLYWLLGSAAGDDDDAVAALHGPRLERILEEIVDTPVRGFVYEAAGTVAAEQRRRGAAIVAAAAERWRIPCRVVDSDPGAIDGWRRAMLDAATDLTGI